MPSTEYASTPPVVTPDSVEGDARYKAPSFPLGPFVKYAHNPLLLPNAAHEFESAYIYNAATIVLDDTVFLLYRAQNAALRSSIGLAWSKDGFHFTRLDRPVLEASEPWEQGGGVEDPRITRHGGGLFVMTYTAWDLQRPRLCLATSTDLVHWTKQPPLFPGIADVEFTETGRHRIRTGHSKSGVIFPEKDAHGKYTMLYGDSFLLRAESDDLVHWTSRPFEQYFAAPLLPWESRLLEPGPPPIKTRDGKYLLVYNAASLGAAGYCNNQYSIGQMLIDLDRLDDGPLARLETPCVRVTAQNEQQGLVNNVVFCEGLVQFHGKWFLYFGQSDSQLGVATADV